MGEDKKRYHWSAEDIASAISWISTVVLIVFIALVALWFRSVFGDGFMGWLSRFIWLPLLIYFNVQLWATSIRESTDLGQWFVDNFLALDASVFGLFLLLLPWFPDMGPEEKLVLMQCVGVSLSDLMWGLVYSQRIAFAGKERGETRI